MPRPESRQLAAAAAALGLDLAADGSSKLLAYLDLLVKWNRVYNLTAIRDPAAMLVQHLVDSLAVVAPLRRHLGGGRARLLDVGSGAGLPGIVLAALMPEIGVTCIDAVGKKAAFVRQAAGELGLANLQAVHARVEDWPGASGGFDLVVSRAFASLADFVTLTQRHCAGVWMAMKGRVPGDEIAALPPGIVVFHVERLAVPGLDAERCLVWLRRTG